MNGHEEESPVMSREFLETVTGARAFELLKPGGFDDKFKAFFPDIVERCDRIYADFKDGSRSREELMGSIREFSDELGQIPLVMLWNHMMIMPTADNDIDHEFAKLVHNCLAWRIVQIFSAEEDGIPIPHEMLKAGV